MAVKSPTVPNMIPNTQVKNCFFQIIYINSKLKTPKIKEADIE